MHGTIHLHTGLCALAVFMHLFIYIGFPFFISHFCQNSSFLSDLKMVMSLCSVVTKLELLGCCNCKQASKK